MTLSPGDDLNETARQRTRDQFALLRQVFDTDLIVDTDDDADFTFACHSRRVLLNNSGDADTLRGYFNDRMNNDDVFTDVGEEDSAQPREESFLRYLLPSRRDSVPGDRSLLVTLDEIEQTLPPGFARPDHLVHICPRSSQCPATEPTETTLTEPWPPKVEGDAGQGVSVVVIDTGWYDATKEAEPPEAVIPWAHMELGVDGQGEEDGVFNAGGYIRPYAGHGTFVAGVVRSMAPKASVYVLNLPLPVDPNRPEDPNHNNPQGGLFESDIVGQLDVALARKPDLISLSAGCHTRQNHPARAFENWWRDVRTDTEEDPVVVAAAGNNSSPWGFWPASFPWALGVGSLDRDGTVSDFSNYGDSADVYALGRNIVNAFPKGTYVCHEAPDRNDERIFANWYARWSGTSFSTPLVAGLIAAAMSPAGDKIMSAHQAKAAVVVGGPGVPPNKWSLTMREVPVLRSDLLLPRP